MSTLGKTIASDRRSESETVERLSKSAGTRKSRLLESWFPIVIGGVTPAL